ncbi:MULTISPECIES: hypothetical protein [unclassified Haloferax]|jgi:hypothetical protein|uniref:hypothetical protein n=1 Tax=unclassified Haloferax TaxID=2625095 RepID=UPI0028746CB5|nr:MULTISPECIES: hypothetical protein [unclassified Haloferax]MDS0243092.1 hypothetical protein [Haloferax sp. S2CR25]MDS0446213.1 hypothetical protein [Haloferax sp. S2CR25-2]
MNVRELSVRVIDEQSMQWALGTFILCALASLYFGATAAGRGSLYAAGTTFGICIVGGVLAAAVVWGEHRS